jgi:hypothetical protein
MPDPIDNLHDAVVERYHINRQRQDIWEGLEQAVSRTIVHMHDEMAPEWLRTALDRTRIRLSCLRTDEVFLEGSAKRLEAMESTVDAVHLCEAVIALGETTSRGVARALERYGFDEEDIDWIVREAKRDAPHIFEDADDTRSRNRE